MKHYSELQKNMTEEQKTESMELYRRHVGKMVEEAQEVLKYAKLMGWGGLTKQMQDFIDEHNRIVAQNGYAEGPFKGEADE